MIQECWKLINNVHWCQTALKLNEFSSGSSEWPQPQPLVVPDSAPLPLIGCSITVLPILHRLLLHPPSLTFPSSITALSTLYLCPLHVPGGCRGSQHDCILSTGAVFGSARYCCPRGASTEAQEPPAKRLFPHDLKFRDFSWTPLGKKRVEHSCLVP